MCIQCYAFVSYSSSNRACDSFNLSRFFAWILVSVKKSAAATKHATEPTTPKPNDQPAKNK